jgi:hypothetical protein
MRESPGRAQRPPGLCASGERGEDGRERPPEAVRDQTFRDRPLPRLGERDVRALDRLDEDPPPEVRLGEPVALGPDQARPRTVGEPARL